MRFGPAIFEAHVRTTVRENYFKWIFQQLTDIHEVQDEDVEEFQLEYNENIYNDLPRTLVCTHSDITRFPFKNCEIDYGEFGSVGTSTATKDVQDGEDDDTYSSANGGDQPSTTSPIPNPADGEEGEEKRFFLVYKNVDSKRFYDVRENQRKDLKAAIGKAKDQYKDILESLKDTIKKIRDIKKTLPETNPMYKVAIAEAKKNLRLFKDPYEEESGEGPLRKKRRRSIENQTRFSDSKVTFFSKANEEMKREEMAGLRKSWESMYKETWNKHLLAPKGPVIDVPVPQVQSIIRDMENDVYQLLADCAGMVEEI